MNIFLAITICLIPIITSLICLKLLMEDFKILHGTLGCVLGLLTIVPIVSIQAILTNTGKFSADTLTGKFFEDLFINGMIEELFKMALLFILPVTKMSMASFFACSVLSGLTLGCFETLVYLVSGGVSLLGQRLLTAVVIHSCCAGLSGLFVFNAKWRAFKILPFIMAVALHGLYDYFAGFKTDTPFYYFSFAVILIAIVECRIRYRAMTPDGCLKFE